MNAKLLLQLQETTAKLQQAEVDIINKDKEIFSLSSELCTKEVELLEALSSTREQESAVQELAYMLAAREASHEALIDTVHAFVSQNVSLPPTPRDAIPTSAMTAGLPAGEERGDTTGAVADIPANESAKQLETIVSFWQERLEAQVAEGSNSLKPRERQSSGHSNTDLDATFSKELEEEEDDDDDNSSSSSDDDDMGTPPIDKKIDAFVLSSSSSPLGPVTPM